VLANLGILPQVAALTFQAPFGSVLLLILSMSVYLSRRYAHTQRDLEHQLERVRVLSEERLAQKRRERKHLIRNELLAAEVKRRTEEFEEARRLQLRLD
jgi:CRISPR/Cas system-associated endonuclease Cas3-HD